ncbi:MAG: hypothetical protein H6719_01125 [Sandaracinaceae bacterium]|nr:hypothetical protein [Sandaracinaceae bacterium]
MSQITKSLLVAALAASVAWVAAPTSRASAQEIQITGPLAGAPAVRRLRQHRVGRVQLVVPTVGYTLQDEFSRSLMVGLGAHVHFTDFLGIGVWGAMANFAGAFQIDTDLTTQVITNGQTTDRNRLSMPSNEGFGDQIAQLLGLASVHLIFAPLRGKLALFQGAFADTDFWILAGFAAAFVEERADVTDASVCAGATSSAACLDSQTARNVRFAPAPMIGVGLNLYFNEFLGMSIQWRAFPFDMNPSGTDESGQGADGGPGGGFPDGQINAEDQRFYFHHMINLGLIINLPPEIQVSD